MIEVYIFNRKELEKYLKREEEIFLKKEDIETGITLKSFFEKCGTFLEKEYIIYSDEYSNCSPLKNLLKYLRDRFDKNILEEFYSIENKNLITEVCYEDLKSDEEVLFELEIEKKKLTEKLEKLEKKEKELLKKR